MRKHIIKQVYGGVIEDLESDVESILNSYHNRVDDFIASSDDNGVEEDIRLGLNSEVCFCEKSKINSI